MTPPPTSSIAADASQPSRRGLLGWLDHRTGLPTLVEKEAMKPVPRGLSWFYTLGTLAAFYFVLQFLTGFLLLMVYVPEEGQAYASLQVLEHKASLGWLVRQLHAWGAGFIVIVLGLHMVKVLWYGSYKRPREFTWFAGCVLFALTLGFCLSGCLLPWNQLAFWASRIALDSVDSIPLVGPQIKTMLCGSEEVSGRTIGRFFAAHVFLLPMLLIPTMALHLYLVDRHGIAPKSTTTEEKEKGYRGVLARLGWETFFPRQIYRELLVLVLGFATLVTVAVFFPFELGERASLETPEGIKPEWYFLPIYQSLKYFDDSLYNALPFLKGRVAPDFLGLVAIHFLALVLFLLPILDFGKQRVIWKRPIFACFAFVVVVGVLLLGVLGYVSERNVTLFGTEYHFSNKGYPTVVTPETSSEAPSASDGNAASSETNAEDDERADSEENAGDDADGDGDPGAGNPDGNGGETDADAESGAADPDPDTDAGAGADGDAADPQTAAESNEETTEEGATEADEEATEEGATTEAGEDSDAASADADAPVAASWSRADGLPPGGTCGSSDCHETELEEWVGSVHFMHEKQCVDCHGGNDTEPPPLLDGMTAEMYAHIGIQLNRRGEPTAPPKRSEIKGFCGQCHGTELAAFSELHEGVSPKKSCVHCHGNHAVAVAGALTYEEGYTDAEDERSAAFLHAREPLAALAKRVVEVRDVYRRVEALHYPFEYEPDPLDPEARELADFLLLRNEVKEARALVHALDVERLDKKVAAVNGKLDDLESSAQGILQERDERWKLVAIVWGASLVLCVLILIRLRGTAVEGAGVSAPDARSSEP